MQSSIFLGEGYCHHHHRLSVRPGTVGGGYFDPPFDPQGGQKIVKLSNVIEINTLIIFQQLAVIFMQMGNF